MTFIEVFQVVLKVQEGAETNPVKTFHSFQQSVDTIEYRSLAHHPS